MENTMWKWKLFYLLSISFNPFRIIIYVREFPFNLCIRNINNYLNFCLMFTKNIIYMFCSRWRRQHGTTTITTSTLCNFKKVMWEIIQKLFIFPHHIIVFVCAHWPYIYIPVDRSVLFRQQHWQHSLRGRP